MHTLATLFTGIAMFISGLFGGHQVPLAGATGYNPTGGGTYRLQTSIGTGNSTLTLSSFKEPISNIPYTMTYLNSSIEYGTVEPQSNNREFVSFTGITQNNDGTATLTGVSRGLASSYPFTASTTLALPHSGQSIFIISNSPAFYSQQFLFANQLSTSTAVLIFSSTTPPRYDATGAQSTGTYIATTSEFASVAYVNAVSFSGTTNATTAVKGIVQIGTALQIASSTLLGTTGASIVANGIATDTPSSVCNAAPCIVMTKLGGKTISQTFLDIFGTNNTYTGSQTNNATTTITASNVNSNALVLNTLPYKFPSTRQASSTVLSEDGSGNLTWESPHGQLSAFNNTASTTGQSGGAFSTTTLINIPAGFMTASSTIEVKGGGGCTAQGSTTGNCTWFLRDGTGVTFASFSASPRTGNSNGSDSYGGFTFTVLPTYTTSAQTTENTCSINGLDFTGGGSTAVLQGCTSLPGGSATSAINLANATTINFVMQGATSNANALARGVSIIVRQ